MIVNLARLVIIALAVWVVVQALRRLLHRPTPSQPAMTGTAKNMVRCDHCGLHLPESEAISDHGKQFCCKEHRHRYSESA
ncbi:MAG: PP0621 family protein [Gammaproteobacteria bacterium]